MIDTEPKSPIDPVSHDSGYIPVISWGGPEKDNYDHLFNNGVDVPVMGSLDLPVADGRDTESTYAKRLKELFKAPIVAEIVSNVDYDALFGTDKDIEEWRLERARIDESNAKLPKITEQSLKAAERVYEESASNIKDIIHRINPDLPLKPAVIVKEIRTNPQVRLALGEYLYNELWNLKDALPERVGRNGQKKPNHLPGYAGYYTSFEYVALLCISMLDGTFDPSKETSESTEIINGKVTLGQHRYSAKLLLGLIK